MNNILKIGHRGAKGYVAENTLESFQKAIDLDINGIELDVHLSKDNIPVVIHDQTIDRTSKGKGFVKEYTSFELEKLNIPTLQEVLNLVNKRCFINIEIKDSKATILVLNLIQKYISEKKWSYKHFKISSFNWIILKEVATINPKIELGVLTENSIENSVVFAQKIKAQSINPFFKLLTPENVKLIHKNGFKIYAWTVNQPEDIIFVKSLNVEAIISDFPDRI